MNEELAAAARSRGRLAGSILGLPEAVALGACNRLVRAGDALHLDIIDEAYPMGAGVPESVWARLDERHWTHADVHLMVGRAPQRLAALARAARVTVHLESASDRRVIDDVLALRERIWISIEPRRWSAEEVDAAFDRYPIDGVLVMLAPPATAGTTAEPERLDAPAIRAARRRGEIGVDGGVTGEIISVAADRGASYFVIGRALLASSSRDSGAAAS